MPRRRDNPEEEEVESRDSQILLQHVPGDGEDIGPNSVTPLNTMNVPEFIKDIRRLVEEVGKNQQSREPDRDLIQETDNKIKGLDGQIGDKISAIDSPTIFKDHIFEDKQIKEKQLIQQLAEFKLEVSVRALLKKLCSANKRD